MADQIPSSATGSKASPLALAFIRELLLCQNPDGYVSLCEVIVNASPPAYPKIESPTLIIAGDEDKSAPLDGCKLIQSQIGGNLAEIKVLEGIGHWHCLEAPEQVIQAITEFIK